VSRGSRHDLQDRDLVPDRRRAERHKPGRRGFAIAQAEPVHASVHVALALVFGLWAWRLLQQPGELQGSELPDRLEAVEFEVSRLRHELGETQERLNFAERLLAQEAEARRMGPPR